LAQSARHLRGFPVYARGVDVRDEEVAAVNLAALIGEVASAVEPPEGEVARFSLAVMGRLGEPRQVFRVQTGGAQAVACRRFLQPGHRIAIEGRVVPGADPTEILAERVQFLTTRAQAESMRRETTVA
jgi:hypothetical protein